MPNSPNVTASKGKPLGAGPTAYRIRLYSGLLLYVFVATHFLNHMLGLVSLDAMEAGREIFLGFWRLLPIEVLLAASLVAHAALAILKAARSNTLKMSAWEWVQLALGLLLPFLVAQHVLGTRGLALRDGITDSYAWTVWALWPGSAVLQGVAIVVVWAHGCIGMHFWLRLKSWYAPVAPVLLSVAVLWPVLAFLGFANAGQDIQAMIAQNADWVGDMLFEINFAGGDAGEWVKALDRRIAIGAAVVIVVAAAWRLAAWRRAKLSHAIKITYPDGQSVSVADGVSVLEASRIAGIPHASVCGGRGRCSTCRIRISAGLEAIAPPDDGEAKVLQRINAGPSVRLACQVRPTVNVSVAPLLPANATAAEARDRKPHETGAEREIAIMFADIRAFTKLSEDKLPFDIVFLLNQYFRSMGQAIESNGGKLDKFIGDGIMALFGIEAGGGAGCRQALAATAQMSKVLHDLNTALANDLDEPLRIGIGVHVGAVIVGEMGYSDTRSLTAIGDAVNVASRLEPMTKDYKAEAIVSEEVLQKAGVAGTGLKRDTVSVRGREQPLDVVVLMNGEELAHHLQSLEAAE